MKAIPGGCKLIDDCILELCSATSSGIIWYHQFNIPFLPRLIKGMDGCFPTALGRQSTFSNILGPLMTFSHSDISNLKKSRLVTVLGSCLSLEKLEQVFWKRDARGMCHRNKKLIELHDFIGMASPWDSIFYITLQGWLFTLCCSEATIQHMVIREKVDVEMMTMVSFMPSPLKHVQTTVVFLFSFYHCLVRYLDLFSVHLQQRPKKYCLFPVTRPSLIYLTRP